VAKLWLSARLQSGTAAVPLLRDRHPFTDPCVSPETMYRCRK
jgi:hypothetical protein